jgi:hypothetical protein
MNTLRQEFCDETNTPMGLDNEFDYIRWLEAQIQALRIHDVSGQSEQLVCDNHRPDLEHFMKYSESICKNCKQKV